VILWCFIGRDPYSIFRIRHATCVAVRPFWASVTTLNYKTKKLVRDRRFIKAEDLEIAVVISAQPILASSAPKPPPNLIRSVFSMWLAIGTHFSYRGVYDVRAPKREVRLPRYT
jgi:hypothetical protein